MTALDLSTRPTSEPSLPDASIDPSKLEQELATKLARDLKRISGHIALKRFERIPEAIERAQQTLAALKSVLENEDSDVFRWVDTILQTEGWESLGKELQINRIATVATKLVEPYSS